MASSKATPVERIMRPSDLLRLRDLLCSHSPRWFDIGIGLGFLPDELTLIRNNLALLLGAPVSHLDELLIQWIKWPTEIHPHKPTLMALCEALKSPAVGLGSLSEEVKEKMEQIDGKCCNLYVLSS